ncbi:uncharacterized protein LOC125498807 [Beta vulgaris subsp. vulgaris]|uniref:uncharacterized protein LOC125498807 n=1 Tax=Beta vulgaris subsp. vulgaris TaxID=3555 RepID=UPI0025489C58|nr:uncharacterized protein LOC125498807 [Beta vulgaris subsp. vulgaris]
MAETDEVAAETDEVATETVKCSKRGIQSHHVKKRSTRLVENEVEESPEIETKKTKDVADLVEEPVMEEEVEDEEEVPLIRRNSKKPATTKSTTTKSTTPKTTTKSTTTKAVIPKSTAKITKTATSKVTKTTTPKKPVTPKSKTPTPKPVKESKPEESEKMEVSEPETESEPVGDSEPKNQEVEEEEVEKEDVVVEPQRKPMQAKKVAAKKPPSKAVKSVEKEGEAKGDAVGAGTSTESVQATYALVKQLSDQNQMMQNMLNSVTQLCTALQDSYRRVEVRLDKAGIQGREDSEAKQESSNAAGDEDDDELHALHTIGSLSTGCVLLFVNLFGSLIYFDDAKRGKQV